jgi:uncharacterized protein (DUF1778 family)
MSIRAEPWRRDLIDRAAEAVGKTRASLMLETACAAAEAVLREKGAPQADRAGLQTFLARLDAPNPSAKLAELLSTKPRWED